MRILFRGESIHPLLGATSISGKLCAFLAAVVLTQSGCSTKLDWSNFLGTTDFQVTSISPNVGPLSGSLSITINGSGFTPLINTANLGGVACAPVTYVSSSQLTCVIGANSAGTVDLQLMDALGTSLLVPSSFTYMSGPKVLSTSPIGGPQAGFNLVHVLGFGFQSGATISIGGLPCTSPTYNSATDYQCFAPSSVSLGSFAVQLVNPDTTTDTLAFGYTYSNAPTVASVSPSSGSTTGGTAITVNGANFLVGATVQVAGVSCTSPVVLSSNQISCLTPIGSAGGATVTVVNPDTQFGTLAGGFTFVPPPTISTVTPPGGALAGGTLVSIFGTNFVSGAVAKVGGVSCLSTTFSSSTQLQCTTPSASAGTYDVSVTNPDGQTATALNAYSYNPAPTLTSVSPGNGGIGGGTIITITGTGFLGAPTAPGITIGGFACTSPTVLTPTSVTCQTPAHAIGGPFDIVLTNYDGQTQTLSGAYTYTNAPAVTSVSPIGGSLFGGGTLTINGTNFVAGATVTVGGSACLSAVVSSSILITCTIPSSVIATAADVVVTNVGPISGTLIGGYSYNNPPTVASVSPIGGNTAGGTLISVTGTGFLSSPVPTVTLASNSTPCTGVVVVSSTQLTCTTGSHAAGTADIKVVNYDAQSGVSSGPIYAFSPAPTISSVSLNYGPLTGGESITINGSGFQSGAGVTLGGVICTPSATLATQITCTTGSHAAGVVDVIVSNPDGQAVTNVNGYTYQGPPTFTAITPAGGDPAGGTLVTITGNGFAISGANVTIGGVPCSGVSVGSSTSLTCTTGAHLAGATTVVITNGDSQTVSATNAYTYQSGPTITSLNKTFGPAAGGQTITVTGTGFLSGVIGRINGVNCATSAYVSATSMTCVTSAGTTGTAYAFTVVNPDTQQAALPSAYTYVVPPTVTAISIAYGPTAGGQSLTITGTGFFPGATALINSVACAATNYTSSTSVTCQTPPGALGGPYSVTVQNSDAQSGFLPSAYSFVAPPVLGGLSNYYGPAAGGQTLSITGSGFRAGIIAQVNGVNCTTSTYLTATTMTCVTPSGALGTPYAVNITNLDGQASSAGSIYTYVPAPTVSSISNSFGPAAGGQSITFTGTGFLTGVTAKINGVACGSTTLLSSTQLTCTTPAASVGGPYTASVFNADLQTGPLASAYTYVNPPSYTSVSPTSGPSGGGTFITVIGNGIRPGAVVTVGGVPCTGGSVIPFTQVTCTTGAGPVGLSDLQIVNTDGQQVTATGVFNYIGPQKRGFAYTINLTSNDIAQYQIDPVTGALSFLPTPLISAGGPSPQRIVTEPRGLYAYVASVTTLAQFSINPNNGQLSNVGSAGIPGATYDMTIDKSGRFIYVSTSTTIYVYVIDRISGLPSLIGSQPTSASCLIDMVIDASNRYLFAADCGSNRILQFRIDPLSGLLSANANPYVFTNGLPQSLAIDRTGTYLYSADPGNSFVDIFHIPYWTGDLTSLSGYSLTGLCDGVNNLQFDATGVNLYASCPGDNALFLAVLNTSSGYFNSVQPMGFGSVSNPGVLMLEPSGRFVYGANQGNNTLSQYTVAQPMGYLSENTSPIGTGSWPYDIAFSMGKAQFGYVNGPITNQIFQYKIDGAGKMTPNTPSAIGAGTNPTSIAMDPRGNHLYALNSIDSSVYTYGIDPFTGQLSFWYSTGTGTNATEMAITPNGLNLYTISPLANSITHHKVNYDGALYNTLSYGIGSGFSPSAIAMDALGKVLFVLKAGGPWISMFMINSDGSLTLMGESSFVCSSASSMRTDPTGNNFYVGCSTGQMYQYNYDVPTGSFTPFSPNYYYFGAIPINAMLIDPWSRFFFKLYNAGSSIDSYFLPVGGDVDNASQSNTGVAPIARDGVFDPTGLYSYFVTSTQIYQNSFNRSGGVTVPLSPGNVLISGAESSNKIVVTW